MKFFGFKPFLRQNIYNLFDNIFSLCLFVNSRLALILNSITITLYASIITLFLLKYLLSRCQMSIRLDFMLEVQFFRHQFLDINNPEMSAESLKLLPIIQTLQSVWSMEVHNLVQESLGFFVPGEGRYGVEVCPQ